MKKILLVMTCGLFILPNFVNVHASDNSYKFNMNVKPYQGNVRTDLRYRQTSHTNNPWKVKMTDSWEDYYNTNDGAITTFWLEKGNGTNVSRAINTAENKGAVYTQAYSSANKEYVHLTAENNNYNGKTYQIKGIWDEETW